MERFLTAKFSLVVLDNLEHLLAATPLVSKLLAACAELKVLATSREALRLQAEHRYVLAPLEVPEMISRKRSSKPRRGLCSLSAPSATTATSS